MKAVHAATLCFIALFAFVTFEWWLTKHYTKKIKNAAMTNNDMKYEEHVQYLEVENLQEPQQIVTRKGQKSQQIVPKKGKKYQQTAIKKKDAIKNRVYCMVPTMYTPKKKKSVECNYANMGKPL